MRSDELLESALWWSVPFDVRFCSADDEDGRPETAC